MLEATAFETKHGDLPPKPINPEWIRKGSPVARAINLTESPDKLLISGIWDCTAGTFRWFFYQDELVYILEGEVTVRSNGKTMKLTPGSWAYFPMNLDTEWEVEKYVKKVFIVREPKVSKVKLGLWKVKEKLKAMAAGRRS